MPKFSDTIISRSSIFKNCFIALAFLLMWMLCFKRKDFILFPVCHVALEKVQGPPCATWNDLLKKPLSGPTKNHWLAVITLTCLGTSNTGRRTNPNTPIFPPASRTGVPHLCLFQPQASGGHVYEQLPQGVGITCTCESPQKWGLKGVNPCPQHYVICSLS